MNCSTLQQIGLAVTLLISSSETLIAQRPPTNTGEQTAFREGSSISREVPIPKRVIALLLHSKEGQQGLAFTNEDDEKQPEKLFRASEIHLKGTEPGLVVIGVCPMCGADNGWFWIVKSAYHNPEIILFAGGNSIDILATRTNGFPDVRRMFSTPSETQRTVYHFDGKRYRIWKDKWSENPVHWK